MNKYCSMCHKKVINSNSVKLYKSYICNDCFNKYKENKANNELRCERCGYINTNYNIVKLYNDIPLCPSCIEAENKTQKEKFNLKEINKFLNKELTPCNYIVVKNKPLEKVSQQYEDQISNCSDTSKPIKPEIFYWLYKKYNKDISIVCRIIKIKPRTARRWMEIYRSDNS